MNILSRTITGVIFVVAGLVLAVIAPWAKFITLIYGIPLLILGFFILLNKKEDKIEQIKSERREKNVKR